MSDVRITAGPFEFLARWEREKSPRTCEAFEKLLPYRQKIVHVRWSGESCVRRKRVKCSEASHAMPKVNSAEVVQLH